MRMFYLLLFSCWFVDNTSYVVSLTACSASGTTAVLYGTMRDNILGLECVLADGKVVPCCNHTAPKSSAGYDLVSLMCGSEGTLGVITKVTVKLHAIPQFVAAAKCSFPNLQCAANSVAMLKVGLGLPLMRCELLDSVSLHAFYQYQKSHETTNKSLPINDSSSSSKSQLNNDPTNKYYPPTLFMEFQGPTEMFVQEQIDLAESILVAKNESHTVYQDNTQQQNEDYGGGYDFSYTWDAIERQQMWKARHDLYYASVALRPGCSGALVTDACVPLSQLGRLLQATADHVQEMNVIGPCFGHVGDGNFHCILPLKDGEDEDYRQRVDQVHQTLIHRALAVGGTCTGEHGIGQGKISYLEKQLGPNGIHMMKLIKQALDPQNIMNPGKILR